MNEPQLGDFGLTKITGITGTLIAAGQRIIGDGCPIQHAYVYVGYGYIVQAMPGGAERILLEDANPPVVWSTDFIPLTTAQRRNIVNEAIDLVGTPYSFADYLSIGLAHFHVRPAWVLDYIADSGHLECSQLVDEAYKRAGINLFTDGRFPGDVTPGDLWKLLQPPRVALAQAQRVDVPWAA